MMSKLYGLSNVKTNRGAILLLALVLLTIMSIVGVSSNRGIILQERMAGNHFDQSVSLQAAESALRVAESGLGNCAPSETNFYGSVDGQYNIGSNPAPDWKVAIDDAAGSTAWIASNLSHVQENPRYMIERLEPIPVTKGQEIKLGEPVQTAELFRITAQGFGVSANAETVIQTIRYTYTCRI